MIFESLSDLALLMGPAILMVAILQFIVQFLLAVALNVIAYLIMPKPKAPKPEAARQAEAPTAEAGKPIPVVFGRITVKDANVLWYGEISTAESRIRA